MSLNRITVIMGTDFLTVCMLSPNKLILGIVAEWMFIYLRIIFFWLLRTHLYLMLNKSSSIRILLESCLHTYMTYTIAECTVNNSWWTEELSETCRVSFRNKFEKLVRPVGFITKKKVTNLLGSLKGGGKWIFWRPPALLLASQERICSSILIQHCSVNRTVGSTFHSDTSQQENYFFNFNSLTLR
jgi:hypothetical protein